MSQFAGTVVVMSLMAFTVAFWAAVAMAVFGTFTFAAVAKVFLGSMCIGLLACILDEAKKA